MKIGKGILAVIGLILSALSLPAAAATITIVPLHGNDGTGFYDATPRAATGGNPGTTVGAQRLFAAKYVATLLGSRIQSDVEIKVSATFTALDCTSNSGTLGHAGPETAVADFPGAPKPAVYYPIALANTFAGYDLYQADADITAEFNSTLDAGGAGCLQGTKWYYGLDGNAPTGSYDFTTTFAHEMLHGLGFISFTDETTGDPAAPGETDIFTTYIRDLDLDKTWPDMTAAEIVASATNDGRLVWDGASVTANGVAALTAGTAGGRVKLYAPNPVEPGSSVSHWDETLLPNALMEPYADDDVAINNGLGLATCLLQDIGWTLMPSIQCPDTSAATAAHLFATPSTLDFGTLVVGDHAALILTVSNTGDKPLTINNLVSPAAPFAITLNDCNGETLFIGMQCQMQVTFTPSTVGTLTDTLGISTNAGTSSINLTGVSQAVPAPVIEVTPAALAFGDVEVGHDLDKTLNISNSGNADLVLGNLAGLAAPFTLSADACSGETLAPGLSCNLTVTYAPTSLTTANDQLTILSNDQNIDVNVGGTGVDLLQPDVTATPASLAFGKVATNSTQSLVLTLKNEGGDTLRISSVSDLDVPLSITADSCNGQDIEVNETCDISVSYHPTTVGGFVTSLEIDSDDPDEPKLQVNISGSSTIDLDDDGVSNEVENAGPNGGDGNHDGTPDDVQAQVATFQSSHGDYVTLITNQGVFTGVQQISAPAGLTLPQDQVFPQGFLAFKVTGVAHGGSATVTVILPTTTKLDKYYSFAPTDSVTTDVSDLVSFNADDLVLTLIDGARGDTDISANGVIAVSGGAAKPKPPASSGGGGAITPWWLLSLLGLAWARRKRTQAK